MKFILISRHTNGAAIPSSEREQNLKDMGEWIALLKPALFADLLTQGVLIAPFPWMLEGRSDYWLLWNDEAGDSHFVRWIKSQFSVG